MQDRKSPLQQLDYSLLFFLFVLMCISLLAVYTSSASVTELYGQSRTFYVQRHLIFWVMGVIVILGTMLVDYELFKKFSIPLYLFSMILLLAVHFFGVEVNGATRWLGQREIGGFRFQPSEIIKVFLILILSHLILRITQVPRAKTFKNDLIVIGKIFAIGLPPFALIFVQPDLGTALVVAAVIFIAILMAGVSYRMIALLIGAGLSFIGFLIYMHNNFFEFFITYLFREHQLSRIYSWLDPSASIGGDGYQLYHAMQGIGAGQLYGSGLGQGVKSQSGFIPEVHTDFIFTVIGEEFGFAGATVLLIVYFLLLYRMVVIAFTCNNMYGTYITAGCVGLLVFQIFQNIGMTIGLVPITGLALPFISYGGSALITNMIIIGIVLNVNIRTKHYMFGDDD